MKLEIKGGVVSAHVHSPEVGKVNEEIDTEQVTGDDLTISFNPTYLIDSLKALNSEKVTKMCIRDRCYILFLLR